MLLSHFSFFNKGDEEAGTCLSFGYLPPPDRQAVFLGELSLTGQVRPVTGALPIALMLKNK
ncbi:MAG: magnesium chelatase domain-containing protein, partial [bacterium]